jgi:hypothetical protein
MGLRVRPGTAALALAIPGILSFIFAVVAENKKPADIVNAPRLQYNPTTDTSTCHYPSDPSLALGLLSIVFLFISAIISLAAFYYPYQGKKVSAGILWRSTSLVVFTVLSMVIFLTAEALLMWATILEFHHREMNVHSGQIAECPSAKAGLFGGAGFLALDATLFFLIALMLTANARSDYLDEEEEDNKGSYGEVTTYPPSGIYSPARV